MNSRKNSQPRGLAEIMPIVPAAQYLRMSDERQQYSIENQRDLIQKYAAQNGFRIVQTYSDPARSGLLLQHRPALNRLLRDVLNGLCPYKAILVYDISRWGRFQDTDEAACYEFLCRRSGIPVHYCAEALPRSSTAFGSLIKSLKRCMAAEFSRELGVRTSEAKRRLVQLGFRMGGCAPYGFQRMMVSADGKQHRLLAPGERKNLRSDHVILVRGPRKEVSTVRQMFQLVLEQNMGPGEIARQMNQSGSRFARPWRKATIRKLLTNPVYVGSNVVNRYSERLGGPRILCDPKDWVVKTKAFSRIVDPDTFERVQAALHRKSEAMRWSDQQLLDKLRWLLSKKGRLSSDIIIATHGMPCPRTLRFHFGSVREAYKRIGYDLKPDRAAAADHWHQNQELGARLVDRIAALFPHNVKLLQRPRPRRPILVFDNEIRVSVILCPWVRKARDGSNRWRMGVSEAQCHYVTVLCRLNVRNDAVHSFLVLPKVDHPGTRRIRENDPRLLDAVRLKGLEELHQAVRSANYRGQPIHTPGTQGLGLNCLPSLFRYGPGDAT